MICQVLIKKILPSKLKVPQKLFVSCFSNYKVLFWTSGTVLWDTQTIFFFGTPITYPVAGEKHHDDEAADVERPDDDHVERHSRWLQLHLPDDDAGNDHPTSGADADHDAQDDRRLPRREAVLKTG